MSTVAPALSMQDRVVVGLASMGDGLPRWLRLRTLWDRVASRGHEDQLAQIGRLLEAAMPEAQAHAQALAAFFKENAEAVNSLFATRTKYGEKEKRGPDYAAYGAERALAFVSASQHELQFVREQIASLENGNPALILRSSDPFCAALDAYMMEEDAGCISGDAFACAVGQQLTEMGVEYGCL